MIALLKEIVAEGELLPAAFVPEEAVHAVDAAALVRAFDHEPPVFEEVAVSVLGERLIVGNAEFDRALPFRDPLCGGKLRSASLLKLRLKLGHGKAHSAARRGGIFDRVFRNIASRKGEALYAVSLVIHRIKRGRRTLLDGAGVLAGCDVKSDRGFRRDYYAVAVAPQEVSVVLEIFRIDPA